MKKIFPQVITILLISSVALHSCQTAPSEKSTTVRIGYLNLVTSLPLSIAEQKGYLTAKGVKFKAVPLATSNQLADAVITGELDCYVGASVVPVFAAELRSPGKIKVFTASEITSNQPFDALLVKDDSAIETLSDLSGKRIAVFPGSTAKNLLRKYLRDNHIELATITFVEIPPSQHLDALRIGFVDVIHAYEPTIAIARSQGGVRILHGSVYAAILSPNPISVSVVSTDFLKKHPKTAVKTIAALQRACRFMKENDKETRSILIKQMEISEDAANRCSILYMLTHDQLDPANFQRFADILTEIGEINAPISTGSLLYH
ncbi:MAG: ABC transporter substrate-binding protein [Planctomycetota bacterium]|nr:MAG: ABC transporter substrate-binding protein [Planctomycetota bacterium]